MTTELIAALRAQQRLERAAPQLLAALRRTLDCLECRRSGSVNVFEADAIDDARIAISAAEGPREAIVI